MKKQIKTVLPVTIFILLLAALWELATTVFEVPHFILPRLSDVFISLWENRTLLGRHFVLTLGEALLGLALSVAVGVSVAIWMERFSLAKRTLYPLIMASQTIPIIALSPIMVMWFGYGIWSKISVVILFTFFPDCCEYIGRVPYGRPGDRRTYENDGSEQTGLVPEMEASVRTARLFHRAQAGSDNKCRRGSARRMAWR